jgi:hypothetical protein
MLSMQQIGGETDAFVHKQSGAWGGVAGVIPMLPAVCPPHAVESDGPASRSCPIYRGMASAPIAGRILAGGGALVGASLVAGGAPDSAAPLAAEGVGVGPLVAGAAPVSAAPLAGAAVEVGPLVAGEASESAAPLAAGDVEAGPFAVGGAPVLAVPLVVAGVAAGPGAVAGLAFGVPFWAARCTGILLKNASHVGDSSAR